MPSTNSAATPHTALSQRGMARTGHCDSVCGRLPDALSAASHPRPAAIKATIALLRERLGLTQRQAEVLHWIAEGKTNDEISLILGCSFFTVKNHLKKIFQHLNVHSRTAAAACAYRTHINIASPGSIQATLPPGHRRG